ncbi:MAG: MFS transporter [Spirochaetaceae bacterium]|nr:MFS transporter [Spirochaetaceae bacterium]MCF7951358.1 MFS transporter [Spirochaetaceae bacterium]
MRTQGNYRNFVLMLSGQLISKLGSSVYLVAVILFIKQLTGSPGALGIFQFIAYLPIVLLTPLGGMFADSAFKKRIIVGSDIMRGIVMITLGLLALQGNLSFGILLAGTFVVSSCTALFLPAAHALFPEIIPSARLRNLNSVKSTSLIGANFAGTSLGGAAFAVFGPAALFIANGFSFALSAIPEAFIRYIVPSSDRTLSVPQVWRLMKQQFREVRSYIHTSPGLGPLLLSYSFVNSLYPPVILALPFLLEEHYGFGPRVFGVALALLLAGGGVGALLYGFLPAKTRYNSRLLLTALGGLAILLALLWPIRTPLYLWCAIPASGAAIGVVHQIITTSLYRLITPSARGKVFGIMESMASFSVPLAYAAAGFLIQAFLVQLPLFFAVMGAAIAVMALLIHFFSRIGQFISQ